MELSDRQQAQAWTADGVSSDHLAALLEPLLRYPLLVQRCISHGVPNPIQLTMRINHQLSERNGEVNEQFYGCS